MRIVKTALLAAAAALAVAPSARAEEVLVNGGFETGTFAGWSYGITPTTANGGSPFQSAGFDATTGWSLRNTAQNYFGTPATPISGYSAYNGFDGANYSGTAPLQFYLEQDFTLAGPLESGTLSFTYGIQSNYQGDPRVFSVRFLDVDNQVVNTAYSYTRPTGYLAEWSPQTISVDVEAALNALTPGTYTLQIHESIPGDYTGPALFAIDNISLDLAAAQAVPLPGVVWAGAALMGMFGTARRLRRGKAADAAAQA